MKKELSKEELENWFLSRGGADDQFAEMLVKQVREGMAKAVQAETGEIDFIYPIECFHCSKEDCEGCLTKVGVKRTFLKE